MRPVKRLSRGLAVALVIATFSAPTVLPASEVTIIGPAHPGRVADSVVVGTILESLPEHRKLGKDWAIDRSELSTTHAYRLRIKRVVFDKAGLSRTIQVEMSCIHKSCPPPWDEPQIGRPMKLYLKLDRRTRRFSHIISYKYLDAASES